MFGLLPVEQRLKFGDCAECAVGEGRFFEVLGVEEELGRFY